MSDTMSVMDRFRASIALEDVDRHPVFPLISNVAARINGITQAEAYKNHEVAREALIKTCKDFGIDMTFKADFYWPTLPGKFLQAPLRNLIPGKHIPEDALIQTDEQVLFPREDYDELAAIGWNAYWEKNYEKMRGKPWSGLKEMQQRTFDAYKSDKKICEENGLPVVLTTGVDSPLMAFSMCRTLVEFTRDLYEVPDKVEAALKRVSQDLIANAIEVSNAMEGDVIFTVLERSSGFYYSLDLFERFEWPFIQDYVDAFIAAGKIPWLHLDTDWSMNIPYFKQLPKGKCICDLDGCTDIFRAKEVLAGHMCISGDVPASLLSLGKPEEVEAYCRKVIEQVGSGSGLMLTSGCECPIDAKPENIQAMVSAGKKYKGLANRNFVAMDNKKAVKDTAKEPVTDKSPLIQAMFNLERAKVIELVQKDVADGRDPITILDDCRTGMEEIGRLFDTGEYFLAELILSSVVFKEVVNIIEPLLLATSDVGNSGTIVIGTPKGDIHDIGKNIVSSMLKAYGFTVHDLGIDVDTPAFIDKVAETNADIVALSALITPTFKEMKNIVDLLEEKNMRNGRYIIVGGGPVTDTVCEFARADAWTLNPIEAVNLCKAFMETKI